jgi:beta-aspartyl-peptidase (threonine type)
LAAGASTGGIGTMLPGRVGDSPLIGSGVYADDDAGAVSMTGRGESIIRIGVAKDIIEKLRGGGTPARAGRMVLERLADVVGGDAGALIVDRTGRMAIRHTSRHMAAGYWRGTGHPVVLDRFR